MGRKGELRGTAVTSGSLLERESSLGVILMLPGALLLMVFMAYPFFLGIWLSLTDSAIGRGLGHFIGLRNFADLLTDTIFHQTAWNTFVYAMVTVPFKAALGLGLALLLNNHMKFSSPIRAAVMMPYIVPTALSTLGWFMIFDPVFSPVSWLFKNLGLIKQNINFLGDPKLAISSVCLANIWRGVPFFGITILAGLQAVPNELHEAAAIDGAGLWHRFRHVTVPHIKGVVMIAASALRHLDLCGFPTDLRSHQGWAGQPDAHLRDVRLPDRPVRDGDRHGGGHRPLHVPHSYGVRHHTAGVPAAGGIGDGRE